MVDKKSAYNESEHLKLLEKIYSLLLEKQEYLTRSMRTEDSYLRQLYLKRARKVDERIGEYSNYLDLVKS